MADSIKSKIPACTSLVYTVLLLGIFLYGFYVRFDEYFANRSIWLDEAALALNVIQRSFGELVLTPLGYNQSAPVGFLLVTKILISILGQHDSVFRLIPFIAGLASLILFYRLLKSCSSRNVCLTALIIFVSSPVLLQYATEFKPYSTDVLFSLIIALSALALFQKDGITIKEGLLLGMGGAVILWFSFPSVFMLGGAAGAVALFYFSKKHWRAMKNLAVGLILWGISFALMYFVSLKKIGQNSSLKAYWVQSAMPLPPYSAEDQAWFINAFFGFFITLDIQQFLFGAVAFILGACAVSKKNYYVFLMLMLALGLTLIASSLNKYPFQGRLLLFYAPFVCLFIAEGLVSLIDRPSVVAKIFGMTLLITTLWSPVMTAYAQLSERTFHREELRPVLSYVNKHRQPEDGIYVYYGAEIPFKYYAERYGFDKNQYVIGINFRDNWDGYRADLSRIREYGRA